ARSSVDQWTIGAYSVDSTTSGTKGCNLKLIAFSNLVMVSGRPLERRDDHRYRQRREYADDVIERHAFVQQPAQSMGRRAVLWGCLREQVRRLPSDLQRERLRWHHALRRLHYR